MVINSLSEYKLEDNFAITEKSVMDSINLLSEILLNVDGNLAHLTDNTKNKISHQLGLLKNKSMKAQENKFDSTLRQIAKAQNLIYPNNNLQERELTIINFINKYGFDFFDWLYNELDIKEFKHQILEI